MKSIRLTKEIRKDIADPDKGVQLPALLISRLEQKIAGGL